MVIVLSSRTKQERFSPNYVPTSYSKYPITSLTPTLWKRRRCHDQRINLFCLSRLFPTSIYSSWFMDPLPSVLEPDLDLLRLDVGEDGALPYELLSFQGAGLRALVVDPLERIYLLWSIPHVLPRLHRHRLLLALPRLLTAHNHRHLAPSKHIPKNPTFPHPTHLPPSQTSHHLSSAAGARITAPQKLSSAAAEGNPSLLRSSEAAITLQRRGEGEAAESKKASSCSGGSARFCFAYTLFLAFYCRWVGVTFAVVLRAVDALKWGESGDASFDAFFSLLFLFLV
ncbi:hypothetical protein BHE74_00024460 [Ensete ventricosum]|nr:hypothetical protein BHE74_00024460 [Ensete ventricosum]